MRVFVVNYCSREFFRRGSRERVSTTFVWFGMSLCNVLLFVVIYSSIIHYSLSLLFALLRFVCAWGRRRESSVYRSYSPARPLFLI